MLKIPFQRCVILTTLDFDRIVDRLESEIYDGGYQRRPNPNRSAKNQHYFGELQGFKFLATRIIGHKHFHLPGFLLPCVEGKIDQLPNGYEISLYVKLHNWMFMLLVVWFGGLFTFTVSSFFDNILGDVKAAKYLTDVGISIALYALVISYFYYAAWRATKFFQNLFAQRLLSTTNIVIPNGKWQRRRQRPQLAVSSSSSDWMKRNLPSLPGAIDRSPALTGKMPLTNRKNSEQ